MEFEELKILSLKIFKVQLPGLSQLLGTENLLKMMKNVFYFTLKASFVLKACLRYFLFFG